MGKPMIVFAGGGTAGHINPLLSTVSALRESGLDFDCFVLGTSEGLEKDLVPGAGLELLTIPRLPLPRRPSLDLVKLPFRLAATVRGLQRSFQQRGVTLLVGFGGYVSTPAYWAARRCQIPIVIHEQNARPGLANRLGAKWATGVALTFATTPLQAQTGTTEVTGLPLRQEVLELATQMSTETGYREARLTAAKYFGLEADKPTVLVTGGSLGALFLNETLPTALGKVSHKPQVLHLTGKNKDQPVKEFVAKHGLQGHYLVWDYLSEMHHALALADVVVCRAGAATVAENSALGIPAIYVPLPHGNGEQALNAQGVKEAGGAFVLAQQQATVTRLRELLEKALDPRYNQRMKEAARRVGTTRGAANLTNMIRAVLLADKAEGASS